jgi:uncharacterized protein (TIGR04255 family)
MYRAKLNKAPLKEVVFELFWDLKPLPNNTNMILGDPQFELALGVFASKVAEKGFVKAKALNNTNVKINYKAAYQFWVSEMKWPVIQIGPGIMTVNDVATSYQWKSSFLPNIKMACEAVTQSYAGGMTPLSIRLQYINSKTFTKGEDPMEFVESQLMSNVQSPIKKGKRINLNIVQQFEQDDKSILNVIIKTNKTNANEEQELVWSIGVEKALGTGVDIFQVLESAHSLASSTFVEMINPDLYATYNK